MAPGPSKGVLFGPVRDWGRPGVKILRTIGGRVCQYQLEDVTSWGSVGHFVELGGKRALDGVIRRAELEKEKYEEEEEISLIERVTQSERETREEVKKIRVVDESTTERAYEILMDENSLTIQDKGEGGILPYAVLDYVQVEVDSQIMEMIKLTAPVPEGVTMGNDNVGTVVLLISTPRSTKEKAEGRRKWWEQQEADRRCRETAIEEEDLNLLTSDEEEEEMVLRKKGKGKKKAEEKTSSQRGDDTDEVMTAPTAPETRDM